ncbi:MAG: B12-binding domain-containing protein [Candidatus Electrothrix sp. YB6]
MDATDQNVQQDVQQNIQDFIEILLKTDQVGAEQLFHQVQEQSSSFRTVDRLIVPALEKIGREWEQGSVALAQVYMSSKICEELMARFLPAVGPEYVKHPRIAIALLEDYHALGKMIISTALRAHGYRVQDYGRLTAGEIAQRVCDEGVDIILISALMLRSALQIKEVRRRLDESGSSARLIVGGAPFRFDPLLWQEVGADATGANAAEALAAVAACLNTEERI